MRPTTWEGSLKNWELQIPYFEGFFWEGNPLGFVPASLPHTLGYACTLYTPTSPLLTYRSFFRPFGPRTPKKLRKAFLGLLARGWRGLRKKRSKKSRHAVKKQPSFQIFGLFFDFFFNPKDPAVLKHYGIVNCYAVVLYYAPHIYYAVNASLRRRDA